MEACKLTEHFQRLLEIERKCDIEETEQLYKRYDPQTLQRKGLCLLNLRVTGTRTGLGGKSLLDLEIGTSGTAQLPSHRFRQGDIVSLDAYSTEPRKGGKKKREESAASGESALQGVVHSLNDHRITVALHSDDLPEGFGTEKYRLNRLVDDVSYRRMDKALEELKQRMENGADSLLRVLLGLSEPKSDPTTSVILKFYDEGLNDPQKDAIKAALAAHELCMIHGPPGTGKTTCVVEIVRHLLAQGKRLLICAPSNIAVGRSILISHFKTCTTYTDNLLERVPEAKGKNAIPMIRLGHPCRILPTVLDISLDAQIRLSDAGQIVADIKREMDRTLTAISKAKSRAERKELYVQLKELRKELRVREPNATKELIKNARIIWSTLGGAGSQLLSGQKFDVVIIDEVSQSMEPETWIAILKGSKVILAGDPLQLPPTIKSKSAAKKGLEITIFDRLDKIHGDTVKRLLTIQYRMNHLIMDWSSKSMYEGKLQADDAVKHRRLQELPNVEVTEDTESVLVFIDTAGSNVYETIEEDGDSKLNQGEAQLAAVHVERLIDSGVPAAEIALITPYNAQVQCIKSLLSEKFPELEIGSVDGFQGREKEAIVISLVRSNEKGEVGFLAESRRLNVAITRAKRHVCLIGDSETVSRDEFMKKMIEYFNYHADLRYAYMYDGFSA